MKSKLLIIFALFALIGTSLGQDLGNSKISAPLIELLPEYKFKSGSTSWENESNFTLSSWNVTSGIAYVVFSEKSEMTARNYDLVAQKVRDYYRKTYSKDSRAGAEDGMGGSNSGMNKPLDGQQHCQTYFHDKYVDGGSLRLSITLMPLRDNFFGIHLSYTQLKPNEQDSGDNG